LTLAGLPRAGGAAFMAVPASSSSATANTIFFISINLSRNRFSERGGRFQVGTTPPSPAEHSRSRKTICQRDQGMVTEARLFLPVERGSGNGPMPPAGTRAEWSWDRPRDGYFRFEPAAVLLLSADQQG
jgi:hypothetical protein